MGPGLKQFAIVFLAAVAARLASEWLINSVRPIRRAVGAF